MLQMKITVSGLVQGVGFRAAAMKKANELQLKGWVKNLPDRNVELKIQGEENKIEAMLRWCNKGPVSSRVESMSVEEEKMTEVFSVFEILK